jgi:hypothetical protein
VSRGRGAGLVALAAIIAAAGRGVAEAPPRWTVEVPATLAIAAGAPATLPIALGAGPGQTISRDGPLTIDVGAPAGVTFRRQRFDRRDAVEGDGASGPRFELPFRIDAPGAYQLTVRVRFWSCGDRVCRPVDVRREVAVEVAPAT